MIIILKKSKNGSVKTFQNNYMKYKVTLPVSHIKANLERTEDNILGIGLFVAEIRTSMVKNIVDVFNKHGLAATQINFGNNPSASFIVEDMSLTQIDALRSLNYIIQEI